MNSVLDWFQRPGEPRSRRLRLHIGLSLGLLAWTWSFALFYWWIGAPTVLWGLTALAAAAGSFATVALRYGISMRANSWITSAAMFAVTAAIPFFYGGVSFSGTAWLLIMPVVGIALGNRLAAGTYTVGLVLVVFAATLLELTGNLPDSIVSTTTSTLLCAVNLPPIALILLGVGHGSRRGLEIKRRRAEEANESLRDEVRRHIETQQDLERTRSELMEAARSAGRAEVATGALHNIGNALNSVSVATGRARNLLTSQRIDHLSRLAELLQGNDDPRLARFVQALRSDLEGTRAALHRELDDASAGIEHVASVVAVQQEHARYGGVVEELSIRDAVEDALTLVGLGTRISVRVRGEAVATTDRHRVLQVLGNLLKNAGEAVAGHAQPTVDIEIHQSPTTTTVEVIDNGNGIEPGALQQIFAHGFTTKASGSGFGLHASALAAMEMGGSLTAASPGAGSGATFTLRIPNVVEQARTERQAG